VFNAIALQAAQHLGIPTNNGTAVADDKPTKKMAPVVPPSVRYSADLEFAKHKPVAKAKTH
jgi:hypothetical protein